MKDGMKKIGNKFRKLSLAAHEGMSNISGKIKRTMGKIALTLVIGTSVFVFTGNMYGCGSGGKEMTMEAINRRNQKLEYPMLINENLYNEFKDKIEKDFEEYKETGVLKDQIREVKNTTKGKNETHVVEGWIKLGEEYELKSNSGMVGETIMMVEGYNEISPYDGICSDRLWVCDMTDEDTTNNSNLLGYVRFYSEWYGSVVMHNSGWGHGVDNETGIDIETSKYGIILTQPPKVTGDTPGDCANGDFCELGGENDGTVWVFIKVNYTYRPNFP